ncbi:MAG TPA: hypothetical protein DD723_10195 [Candidatus Omnitrophica bacterium]|nr:MAG: hypothetical protein A2Z81_05320 [Omnitrophica WOR_2 bacterium GWA2_45_18]OGX21031.1 MAG: hypothetical protein A2Y04_00980 [Omnitrophica WOR_2 bacterium GWC2_45_7]HBR15888.1 hypothetical protein [Candidatus Omnitrophota bacterium]
MGKVNLDTKLIISAVAMAVTASQPIFAAMPDMHGFAEFDYGAKVSDDNTKRDDFNLFEQRLQLKTNYFFEGENYLAEKRASVHFKGDFTVDEYFSGKTDFELREFNLSLTPYNNLDVKLGRQVLTWGTGDYLFVNDLFPKDYVSFFSGRDDEYLKKPSDALKMSFFPSLANVDFVISRFESNTIAEGDRLSFFDSFQGGIAGTNSDRDLLEPPSRASNLEYALRIYQSLESHELAFYYFRGFDKNPNSYKDETARQLFYPRLDVYGGSLRGPVMNGIGNVEFGYDNSREDSEGNNRLIENSKVKILSGYEKDLGNDFKVGLQYLYEQKLDYDDYKVNLLPADFVFDELRHLLTQRITKLFKNQTVNVSLFNFYSPSDKDGYVRPTVSYHITDQWKSTLGANLPWGEEDMTEFGQMKRNKNVYIRVRYSF